MEALLPPTGFKPSALPNIFSISKNFEKLVEKQLLIISKNIYIHIFVDTGNVVVHNSLYLRLWEVEKKV